MATVEWLADRGQLKRHDPSPLPPRAQVHRRIFLTLDCVAWIEDHLDYAARDWNPMVLPCEQVDAFFVDFVIGATMQIGKDLKKLQPIGDNVWEMRTDDVRVAGFFHKRGTFIATGGGLKKNLKTKKQYQSLIDAAKAAIKTLGLDDPVCITGNNANDVL